LNTRVLRKGVPDLCSQSLQSKGVGGKVFEVKHLVEAFFEVESLSWRAALVWLRGGRRWEVFGACVQSGFFVIFSKGCSSHECDYFCGNFQRPRAVERTRVRDPLGRRCWAPQKMGTWAKAPLYVESCHEGPLFHKPRRRAVLHTSPERGTSAGTRILRTLDYGRGLLVRRWGAA